jgi:uncharacterized MAPEG superfamily protein
MRAGKVRAPQSARNREWAPDSLDALPSTARAASEADQAAREKDARIVAVRLQLHLGHDPVAHREIAAMLEVSA